MEEIIVTPNQAITLQPGERIEAVGAPLRIRVGQVTLESNSLNNAEEMLWESQKSATGCQTAVYRRGKESRLVYIVPESPNADSFGFADGGRLTTTSRVFKIQKADLLGWLPQDGDTLDYQEKTYNISKTAASDTFYQDIGNKDIMLRIFVMEYR
ncbi:MAG: hypothetical protein FWE95_07790 [Planctomycetaceae bacterium]|nr:hypothetical protein [Planctomycetaceae bacterium]